MQKTDHLVMRISPSQKETLRVLSAASKLSMAQYIITKLKLDRKAS